MDTYISKSPEETEKFAAAFAHRLEVDDLIALIGNLGSGKTCFVRGLARGLGFAGRVHSPTFTLVQTYETESVTLFHLDLYRLTTPDGFFSAGIEDCIEAPGLKVVEWAENWPGGPGRSHWRVCLDAESEWIRKISYERISL